MTTGRAATVYVETATAIEPTADVAAVYIEAAVDPLVEAFAATVYIEVVVSDMDAGGWGVGMIRMGNN